MTKLIELRCPKCGAKLCEFIGTVSIKCKRCKSIVKESA
ncbi:DNA-directed RNA polymerase subunit P [Vibrio phage vB_Va_Val-yong3]|nr:DNA-directed RNA polymerase subunit P [Vibrio phage vB_Va_Val-yong3]